MALKALIHSIIGAIVAWAMIAFYLQETDTAKWSENARYFMLCGIVITFVMSLMTSVLFKEPKLPNYHGRRN